MINWKIENGVMEVVIQRPEKRNAINRSMYGQLTELLDEAVRAEGCKAIIFSGAGGNFTVGADVGDFQTRRGNEDSPAVVFLRKLASVDIPLIAAVEGFAVGIGTTMLLHFDFVYAAQNTRFRMPFVELGLCPEGASSYLLEQVVGPRKARDWLLTGRFFECDEAFGAGLLTDRCAPGETIDLARATAERLSRLPIESTRTTKRMMNREKRAFVQGALDDEVLNFANLVNSEAAQKIFKAFLAKAR